MPERWHGEDDVAAIPLKAPCIRPSPPYCNGSGPVVGGDYVPTGMAQTGSNLVDVGMQTGTGSNLVDVSMQTGIEVSG